MSVNSNYSNLNVITIREQVLDLYKRIGSQKTIDLTDAAQLSSELLELHKAVNSLYKERLMWLVKDEVLQLAKCRKWLLKSQSRLLKKIDPSAAKSSELHSHIAAVFKRVTNLDRSQDFAAKFRTRLPKDSISLEGLHSYTLDHLLKTFREALAEKDTKKAETLFRSFPTALQKSFERSLPSKQPLEAAIQEAAHNPKELLGILEKEILSFKSAIALNTPPFVSSEIHPVLYLAFRDIIQSETRTRAFQELLLKEAKIELKTRDEVRDYILRNMNHPYLEKLIYKIQMEFFLKPILEMIDHKDYIAIKVCLNNLGTPGNSILKEILRTLTKTQVDQELDLLKAKFFDPEFALAVKQTIEFLEEKTQEIQTEPPKYDGSPFVSIPTVLHFGKPLSGPCKENLQLGHEAITYAQRQIFFSSNYANREEKFIDMNDPTISPERIFDFACELRADEKFEVKNDYALEFDASQKKEPFTRLIADIKSLDHFPFGNCGELAFIILHYFFKMRKKKHCEIVYYSNSKGNHVFNILDRKEGSDLNDPKSWGPNTVVIDAWNRFVCTGDEFGLIVQNYEGVKRDSGLPVLAPFDPKTQTFKIEIENVMTYDRYQKEQGKDLAGLKEALNKFHASSLSKEKKQLAEECLKILKEDTQATMIQKTLIRQLDFYLHGKLTKLASNFAPK